MEPRQEPTPLDYAASPASSNARLIWLGGALMLDMLLAWGLTGLRVYVTGSPDSPEFISVQRILIVLAVLWVVGLAAFVLMLIRRFGRSTGNGSRAMRFYWSYKTIPELASLPKTRQREIWEECCSLSRDRSPRTAVFLTAMVFIWTMMMLGYAVSAFIPVTVLHDNANLTVLVVFVLAYPVLNHFRIVRLLPEIRRRVGGLCLACGYDLRASKDRCPECGTPIPSSSPSPRNAG